MASNPRILVLDRPTRGSEALARRLADGGYDVHLARDAAAAHARLREEGCDVALWDEGLGGGDLLREALALPGGPPVILLDDFASACDAVEAIRRGAFDVLSRPLSDEQVLLAVARALAQRELASENARLRRDLGIRYELSTLQSRDPRMRRVFELVESVADTRATLLVTGESGTGKTALARAVHERSARSGGPFVEVNCGALPEALLESELFGHAKGAFTGAVRDRAGKFEAADGGTILLDEIATASPELQVKLLRVLESRRFERVGEERPRQVDARVICATNGDLAEEVAAGRFREDLYWRIHVVAVEIPPLRERPADVPLLAERFLARFAAEHGRPGLSLSPAALARLCAHPWPGNVRELENTLERGVLLARGETLEPADLWPGASPAAPATAGAPGADPAAGLPLGPLKEVLEIPERAIILRSLERHGWRRRDTAEALGINRTTLFNKMRKYDLREPSARAPREEPRSGV